MIWLVIGLGGLLFRTVQLFFIRDVETGLVWMTKILTDPFHDIKLYHKAPLALLRGELIDPGLESARRRATPERAERCCSAAHARTRAGHLRLERARPMHERGCAGSQAADDGRRGLSGCEIRFATAGAWRSSL